MKPETCEAIEAMQVLAAQLGSLLLIVSRTLEAEENNAIAACAVLADKIADGLDHVPGFVEGQHKLRSDQAGGAA